jgi:hypothetical protein
MKAKFTFFMIFGVLMVGQTYAQDWNRKYDNRNDGYGTTYRSDIRDNRYYNDQLNQLQSKLNHELNELDRAMDWGNREKVYHERQEIAAIREQIEQLNWRRRHDDDDDDHYRNRWFRENHYDRH